MDIIKGNKVITKRADGSKRVTTVNNLPTRTQQQYKDQVNVNNIISKFKKTGSITHVRNAQEGVYMDLTELPSLQEAHEVVIAASKAFEAVPSKIRQRFGHDPQQMLDFLKDKNNDEEAIKLGLKVRQAPPTPDPVLTELQSLNKNIQSNLKKTKSIFNNKA